jgi:RNA polymerase sigma-70 factor, ECF subfamily
LEDSALVADIRRGNDDAFRQLVERYQTPVYNLAFRMLGNPSDAEDAAQETFLRAYARLNSFRPKEKFATWLLSIAAHYCIDRMRRRSYYDSLDDDALRETLPNDGPMIEDDLLQRENEKEIIRLLDHLEPTTRLVVVLKYWHDQSIEEIARTIDSTIGAVKVKLHRARKALRAGMIQAREQPAVRVGAIGGG